MSTQASETPLSPQQRHLWRLQTDSRAYRSQCTVLLRGDLDTEALRRALGEAVARHEALRTTFRRAPGVRFPAPVAVAEPPAPLWQTADVALDELERQASRRPFDLERGPLVHAFLGRLDDGLHALVLSAPALCADGASLDVLVREVAAAYAGEHPTGEPLQYGAAAHWLNETLAAEESRAGRDHWREQGRPERFALRLPFEARVAGGFAPESVAVPLPPGTEGRVNALAGARGAAPGDVLLAAWQVLLWRLDGEAPGAGVCFDGRPYDELRDAVGPYARWLPFPSRVSPGLSFASLVDALRADREEADGWQVSYAPDEREGQGLPACFELWERPAPVTVPGIPGIRGVTFEPVRRTARGERFKLCLSVTRDASGLGAELGFDSRLLAPEHATAQAERFARLLDGLLEAPERPVSEAPAVSAEEVAQVLAWQGAAVGYPTDVCLHRLIEAQVERTPGAVALEFEGEELTCRQLDERANRLARRLRALGVGAEARVAVCLERSLDLVVSLLAVLKAGGAYVPLDPGYPPERLAYMLADSAAAVLITEERLLAALAPPEGAGPAPALCLTLCLDTAREEIERESGGPLPDAPPAEALAYVIYTSGSTGRPKGAMNTHRAIVNRLLWMQDAYSLTAEDRVLQKTPASFDVSVWELFWPLLAGARLVVARPGGHQDPAYLADVIVRRGITTIHFVPSMLLAFLDAPGVEACAGSLKRVICSGEALTPNLVDGYFQRLDGVELYNLYGPTEAAVDVTAWPCQRERSRHGVPIGQPVANTSILLLDADRRPVPPGAPGELYIGGVQVGRGYLGRPDLTAERFVPDPFASASGGGARLYRTGDLARHEADGAVDFLGRVDHQVKVRGFRIELGEVESALASHPGVREVAVLAREDMAGERRLVAYYTPREQVPTVDELRRFLGSRLPDFMVPALFVRLAALPLTPSGKLDRAALPAPGSQRPDLEHEYVAPGNPVEQALAEVWSEVLGIDRIGIHDSFFALGGDSIRSVRVAALAQERGVGMAVEDLFRHHTIAALAAALAEAAPALADSGPTEDEDLERLVAELEALSDEEAQERMAVLEEESSS